MISDEKIECEFLEAYEMGVISFLVEKCVFVLSHTSSYLTLQMKMVQMRLKGKNGG